MPADPEFLRLARVTAMGLASRLRFTFDEIEDLREAINEGCFWLIGNKPRAGTVELSYRVQEQELVVTGTGHFEDDLAVHGLTMLSELILRAVTDEFEVSEEGDGPPWFRLLKRRAS